VAAIPVPVLRNGSYTFEGYVDSMDKAESDYLLLPFDVGEGVTRLHVRYEYSDETGADLWAPPGNVVDLGIFDSRGSEFLHAKGFRGTSGSARHEFTIGLNDATPGYLPGPIYPGRWHVLLGLYRIVDQGCHYRVVVTMMEGQVETASDAQPYLPGVLSREARWYRGDLHCHSYHSEASGSLGDLVRAAREQGLEFLAVTEHNTVSHLREFTRYAPPDLLLIPGEEITTYYGHANVWGISGWHDFRARSAEDMQHIIDYANERGVLFSINHPKEKGPPWRFGEVSGYNCIEAWQAYWFVSNYQSLSFWDERLRRGMRVTAVGGSDCHIRAAGEEPSSVPLGTPTTWVYSPELSVEGILGGIRAGHVFVNSGSDDAPRVYLEAAYGNHRAMAGDELVVPVRAEATVSIEVVGGDGMMLRLISAQGEAGMAQISGDEFRYEHTMAVKGADYLRAEIIAPPEADLSTEPAALWLEALSNPIYFRIAG